MAQQPDTSPCSPRSNRPLPQRKRSWTNGEDAERDEQPRLGPKTYASMAAQGMGDNRLRLSDVRVLWAISWHADAAGFAWPSQGRIGELTHMTRETVNRCIKRLEGFGYLTRTKKRKRGHWAKCGYQLIRRAPPDSP